MTPDFRQKVALFGGSFDPLHQGHLHVAESVRTAMPGWQIVFVPAGISPGKPAPRASAGLRLEFLRKAVLPLGFGIWDCELRRNGASYTVDTLREAHQLGAGRDRWRLVMGADSHLSFPVWKDPTEIRRLAQIVILGRPGSSPGTLAGDDLQLSVPLHPASSTAAREALSRPIPEYDFLPIPVADHLRNLTLLSQNPYVTKKE